MSVVVGRQYLRQQSDFPKKKRTKKMEETKERKTNQSYWKIMSLSEYDSQRKENH